MALIPLYDNAYLGTAQEIYSRVRGDTYDLDLGQTGWMNAEELRGFLPLLNLTPESHVLEVGCGAGVCALYLTRLTGARITGIDANPTAIEEARRATESFPNARASFEQSDANEGLPFGDSSFDAVFANDSMCHIPDRGRALKDWSRVLKPGGRLVFTDAMIVTGPITSEQLMTRSSIGVYVFLPPGENERLIREAGFDLIAAVDLTSNAAEISQRWHDARARRQDDLVSIEGMATFQGLQKFLNCVHTLSKTRALSRFMYAGRKGPTI